MRMMKNNRNETVMVIGIDHGYGNMKTATRCFPSGVARYDKEPIFQNNLLVYNGMYYQIGEEHKHHLDYIILTTDNSMMKIGQYPSIADMTFPELDAYKHVISKQDRKELGTAIGLFASGIGAGSYVYLRRILERLIYQAKATAGDKVNDEEFEQARVAERIKMLQGYLPEILIKNTTIYGILSKGIHELSEEECKKYFPVVKECIYQILGMWESERRKKADEDALSKALSSISSSIK